jgi:mRNA-degrading endonuclease RelE of RelBE toxin-antitoxin system
LGDLSKNPYTGKLLTGELTGLWSLRVSRHRIIYQIQQRRIAVVHIGPRKDVYEQLREMLTRE